MIRVYLSNTEFISLLYGKITRQETIKKLWASSAYEFTSRVKTTDKAKVFQMFQFNYPKGAPANIHPRRSLSIGDILIQDNKAFVIAPEGGFDEINIPIPAQELPVF